MTGRRICHERALDCGCLMSQKDALTVCQEIARAYPEIVFFAPAKFDVLCRVDGSENKWESSYRQSTDLTTLYAEPLECIRSLQREQTQFERAPAVLIAMRAPWPEEIATGHAMSMRGQDYTAHSSLTSDDPQEWRDKGRLVEFVIPPATPRVAAALEMQEYNWLRDPEGNGRRPSFTQAQFGGAKGILRSCHFAKAFTWYNVSDPNIAAFIATFRRLYSSQVTGRLAWYDPATGRYLDKYRDRYRLHIGRDLLRWLCHHQDVFETFSYLTEDNPGLEGHLAAIGPAPDFKAEVFLEDGLPIDDIEGLTDSDRDRLKRRFEKKRQAGAKAKHKI